MFGCLDKFSAFVFENYLGKIKSLLRCGPRSLQQVYKRHQELREIYSEKKDVFPQIVLNFQILC